MGIYNDYVVPRLVTCACGTKPVLRQRQKVVPNLEIDFYSLNQKINMPMDLLHLMQTCA